MRFFACGREDGCFAAPAASRCCACGRKLVLRLRAQASGGHISFCEERNVGKKVA